MAIRSRKSQLQFVRKPTKSRPKSAGRKARKRRKSLYFPSELLRLVCYRYNYRVISTLSPMPGYIHVRSKRHTILRFFRNRNEKQRSIREQTSSPSSSPVRRPEGERKRKSSRGSGKLPPPGGTGKKSKRKKSKSRSRERRQTSQKAQLVIWWNYSVFLARMWTFRCFESFRAPKPRFYGVLTFDCYVHYLFGISVLHFEKFDI